MTSSPTTLDEIYRHIITVNLGQSAPADVTLGVLLLALGNALQAGTSGQVQYVFFGSGESEPTYGLAGVVPLMATGPSPQDPPTLTVTSAPLTVPAGAGNGFNFNCTTPTFASGALTVTQAQILVSNADGTEKLALALNSGARPYVLASGINFDFNMTAWTVLEHIGTDLSLTAGGDTIDSTAGGQYMCQLVVELSWVP